MEASWMPRCPLLPTHERFGTGREQAHGSSNPSPSLLLAHTEERGVTGRGEHLTSQPACIRPPFLLCKGTWQLQMEK